MWKIERKIEMLYTCKDAKFNDAKNERELIEYAKAIVQNEFFRQSGIGDIDKEINKICDVNTANEALEKYAGERWYPITDDQEIKDLIHHRLELDAYDAFRDMLETNGLIDELDEKVISDSEMVKLADANTDNVLEEYSSLNAGNSSVNQFVDQYMKQNGVKLAEQIFSFDQYWDKLVVNAIDNLVANGVDIEQARKYCIQSNGQDVQIAAYDESDAESIADKIKENEE